MVIVGFKDVFDSQTEHLCNAEGQRQAGVVFAGLQRVHGLPGLPERLGQRLLRPRPFLAQFTNPVFHRYLRLATPAPIPHRAHMSNGTNRIGM